MRVFRFLIFASRLPFARMVRVDVFLKLHVGVRVHPHFLRLVLKVYLPAPLGCSFADGAGAGDLNVAFHACFLFLTAIPGGVRKSAHTENKQKKQRWKYKED